MNDQQKTKGVVDMVFLLDATGSMQPCIDALKNNIQLFVASLTTKNANNTSPVKDWRAKVVGYRDYEHDAIPFIDNPFITTADSFRSQLAALNADGGGDEPESLLEALHKVASMPATAKAEPPQPNQWRHRSSAARVVIIFTDAPFKEPLAEPRGAMLEDVINVLMTNRIILSIFAPEMPCYDRLGEVDKAEYIAIEGGATPQESLALFTANKENFKKTLDQLAKTVSKTAEVLEVPPV